MWDEPFGFFSTQCMALFHKLMGLDGNAHRISHRPKCVGFFVAGRGKCCSRKSMLLPLGGRSRLARNSCHLLVEGLSKRCRGQWSVGTRSFSLTCLNHSEGKSPELGLAPSPSFSPIPSHPTLRSCASGACAALQPPHCVDVAVHVHLH